VRKLDTLTDRNRDAQHKVRELVWDSCDDLKRLG
jgi:hypothetical protein